MSLKAYRRVVFLVGAGLGVKPAPPTGDRLSWLQDPEGYWQSCLNWRKAQEKVAPLPLLERLARFQSDHGDCHLLTTNQDGGLLRAGASALELHGSYWRDRAWGAIRRPEVVWPGEEISMEIWGQALDALGGCDAFVSLGTALAVPPASELPGLAREQGAWLLEINPEPTPGSSMHHQVVRGAAEDELVRWLS